LNFSATTLATLSQDGRADDLDQASAMTDRVISTAASIGGLILITVIGITIVLIVIIVVRYRQQRKFKIKRDGHRHTGLGEVDIAS
jgi:heme/copper-type cytochrome/quinol oxidase subunit 2